VIKGEFSPSLLQSSSHDPPEIILIWNHHVLNKHALGYQCWKQLGKNNRKC